MQPYLSGARSSRRRCTAQLDPSPRTGWRVSQATSSTALFKKRHIEPVCVWTCGWGRMGRGGGGAALWHPGCRPGITDVGTGGSCLPILLAEEKLLQMATASRERTAKTEEFMTEIMERKRKKHFQCTRFIFSLLPSGQMNSSTKAEGRTHCRAIRASGAPSIKNPLRSALTQTAYVRIICIFAWEDWGALSERHYLCTYMFLRLWLKN